MEPEEYARTSAAEERHFWFRELRWIWRGLASREGIRGGAIALDAGCGTGANLRLIEQAHRATGIDLSPLALSNARTKAVSPLVRGSILSLPFRDGTFDLILCADVIYHANVADDVAALREMGRILRTGGTLIVNVPAFESLRSAHDRAVHTARRYNRAMLRDRLTAAGLVPRRVVYWNSLLLPVAALVRWLRKGDRGGSDIVIPPPPLNGLLSAVSRIDAGLALLGLFPAGLSVAAAARKGA